MNIISTNLGLRMTNNNINPNILKDFLFKNIEELPVNLAPFLVSLIKISANVKDCQAILDRTTANLDLNNNHKPDNDINGSDDIDLNVDLEKCDEVISLGDNMPCIADHPIIE